MKITDIRCYVIEDEHPPVALTDRLAFHIWLDDVPARETCDFPGDAGEFAAARGRLPHASTGDLDASERFDLITACDCIHDFAAPERTLQEIHGLLEPQGTLFIIEPKAGDRLEDNINPIGTMFYGFSIFHCMTQSLARGGPGLGTCLGPARTELAAGAGVKRGYVHGKSDKTASAPVENPVHPGQLLATIYHSVGIRPDTITYNHLNQPRELVPAEIVSGILG